jgi:hypothetical protein
MIDDSSIPLQLQDNAPIAEAAFMNMVDPVDLSLELFMFIWPTCLFGIIIKRTPCHFNTVQQDIQVELMP